MEKNIHQLRMKSLSMARLLFTPGCMYAGAKQGSVVSWAFPLTRKPQDGSQEEWIVRMKSDTVRLSLLESGWDLHSCSHHRAGTEVRNWSSAHRYPLEGDVKGRAGLRHHRENTSPRQAWSRNYAQTQNCSWFQSKCEHNSNDGGWTPTCPHCKPSFCQNQTSVHHSLPHSLHVRIPSWEIVRFTVWMKTALKWRLPHPIILY